AVAPFWKPVPVIVTEVPPAVEPLTGERVEIAGGGTMNVKLLGRTTYPLLPGLVTVTPTVPAAWAGAVAVSWIELLKVTEAAATSPNLTVAPLWKLVPVIVTEVPPLVKPCPGETRVMVGAVAAGKTQVPMRGVMWLVIRSTVVGWKTLAAAQPPSRWQ